MHGVVEEVAEARDETLCLDTVVVRAEDGNELGVGERGAYAPERSGVDDDVGVDENEHVAGGPRRPVVAGLRRPGQGRLSYRDHLVGRKLRARDRLETPVERRRVVGGRDDRGQSHVRYTLRGVLPRAPARGEARPGVGT